MRIVREPALIIGIVGAVLTSAAALGLDWLSPAAAAGIVAFLSAIVIAIRTRPVAPALFVAAGSALVAVMAQYGLHLSDAWVGFLTSLVLGGFALFGIRPQVAPSTASGRIIEGATVTGATVAR
jgi:hypothetical protein